MPAPRGDEVSIQYFVNTDRVSHIIILIILFWNFCFCQDITHVNKYPGNVYISRDFIPVKVAVVSSMKGVFAYEN